MSAQLGLTLHRQGDADVEVIEGFGLEDGVGRADLIKRRPRFLAQQGAQDMF